MDIAKSFIILGFVIFFIGFILYLGGDKLGFFGNLLGDFKYQSKNIKIFIPITSMLIISFFISVIINLISRIFK